MSENIKFRIYDTVEKEMFYQEDIAYIDFNSGIASIYQENGYDYLINFSDGDGELMQYTGKKDKDGREIYKDDILKGKKVIGNIYENPELLRGEW